jgi:hypothetical protein
MHAGVIRGTFSAPWSKGATATVTDANVTGATFTVKNYLTPISGTGTKNCVIACVGTEWVLVDFDLTELDGFDASKTQVLSSVSGSLKWLDTTVCT